MKVVGKNLKQGDRLKLVKKIGSTEPPATVKVIEVDPVTVKYAAKSGHKAGRFSTPVLCSRSTFDRATRRF
jgi:hypothetical protein